MAFNRSVGLRPMGAAEGVLSARLKLIGLRPRGVVYAGANGQESKGDARKQIHPITIGGLDEWQLLFSTR